MSKVVQERQFNVFSRPKHLIAQKIKQRLKGRNKGGLFYEASALLRGDGGVCVYMCVSVWCVCTWCMCVYMVSVCVSCVCTWCVCMCGVCVYMVSVCVSCVCTWGVCMWGVCVCTCGRGVYVLCVCVPGVEWAILRTKSSPKHLGSPEKKDKTH